MRSNSRRRWKKFNKLSKDASGAVSSVVDIAKQFTPQELKWLRRTGRIAKYVGRATYGLDAALTIDAYANGEPWGWHAYNTVIGIIGTEGGMIGAATATSIDGYVSAGQYTNRVVNTFNTQGPLFIMHKIIMWR